MGSHMREKKKKKRQKFLPLGNTDSAEVRHQHASSSAMWVLFGVLFFSQPDRADRIFNVLPQKGLA